MPFDDVAYGIRRQKLLNHKIVGVAVHDAKLVATMLRFGITNILTLNGADFQRYPNIVMDSRLSSKLAGAVKCLLPEHRVEIRALQKLVSELRF